MKPKVVNAVIENLNEYIRVGCDYPVDEMNTFRLSTCQYLAYIYTYRVISTTTLFNVRRSYIFNFVSNKMHIWIRRLLIKLHFLL